EADAREAASRPEASPRGAGRGLPVLGAAAAGLGWLAAVALLGLAARALVVGALQPATAPAVAARTVAVAGLGTAHDVRATRLDNALAGPILVVRGRLDARASAGSRGVEVQLVGPGGEPLPEAAAWAGPPLSDLQLRELAPEVLREELARGASRLTAGGGGPFHAVFAEVPPGAADVSLRARPLPSTSPPPTAAPPAAAAPATAPPSSG
ncbi:MAG: hypothetical protein R3263_12530, partial [Myxococcota bacterium]|nr:hypothetical protein [Myxococcota bacterium]